MTTSDSNERIRDLYLKIGKWEGISYLILLFVAMPLKYLFDIPLAARVVGLLLSV